MTAKKALICFGVNEPGGKWNRLTDVAEGGIAGLKTNDKKINPFIGKESFSINGVPAWKPGEEPSWNPENEKSKRIKEIDWVK